MPPASCPCLRVIGAVGTAAFFWIYLPTYDVFGTSVAPALATLIPLEERRTGWKYFVAALLFAAAAWINAAIGLAMLFLIVATVFTRRPAGESLRQTRKPEASVCDLSF